MHVLLNFPYPTLTWAVYLGWASLLPGLSFLLELCWGHLRPHTHWKRPFSFLTSHRGSRPRASHALVPATCLCDLRRGSSIKRVRYVPASPGSVYLCSAYASPQDFSRNSRCSTIPWVHVSCTWKLLISGPGLLNKGRGRVPTRVFVVIKQSAFI